ncbi:uncharacterized protein PV09_06101 [Verruconis gallopava]|uniref:DUF7729 domain-containing protein n=1 Tax=Verruconis gallopava TaxID=253628 RepID=A0A0D2AU51_9PEZI|nr:uncharacterized protein PV09_06101 [Verruconis gallopava]KIW02664.1 hypothetical protein PV09_06101 [Verruconis gallopava]
MDAQNGATSSRRFTRSEDHIANRNTSLHCVTTRWSRLRWSIFTFLLACFSLLSVVSAAADPLPTPAERRLLFDDLGARRMMERAATTSTEQESSASKTSSESAASSTATYLPQPFDTTLGNNFTTDSCPKFFINFLSNATFQSCYPFSLLLQTSHGFFEAEKNFYQTTAVLQAGCDANYNTCNNLMQSLAVQLKSSSNCQSDYNAENQIVMQAYYGFITYPLMYQAACQKDSEGDYCFANAVAGRNNGSLADAYSYYLPLGTTMPVGTRPSCSDCLKRTMGIFRSYASNSTQPISTTYVSAAQQVNMACGPEWVSDVIQKTSDASIASLSPWLWVPAFFGALFILW